MKDFLGLDEFLVGIGHLERFFRRSLKPFDRDQYYEAVKTTTPEKWEKVIRYAYNKAKVFPKPVELREWLGIGEELTPAEEAHGNFKAGTIRGFSPGDICRMAQRGDTLPFDDNPWEDETERLVYLDEVYLDPPPAELGPDGVLAWIRKLSEQAEAKYAEAKEKP
jgi:hypothetical protein